MAWKPTSREWTWVEAMLAAYSDDDPYQRFLHETAWRYWLASVLPKPEEKAAIPSVTPSA